MHEQRPSQTASFVALWRALADRGYTTVAQFSDPFASALLSPGWQRFLRFITQRLERQTATRRAASIANFDAIALRVLAIDRELAFALDAGIDQLVILGAGLDTRAYRLATLASADVFEVDHPATQAYKRRKVEPLTSRARSLHFVAVDFARDNLADALARAGHRADRRTVWIWEGVVMYLDDRALDTSLKTMARISAAGSRLLLHYHDRFPKRSGVEKLLSRVVLRLWSEPQIGLRAPDAMQCHVRGADFTIDSDTRTAEWVASFGAKQPVGHTAAVSRLLVAHR